MIRAIKSQTLPFPTNDRECVYCAEMERSNSFKDGVLFTAIPSAVCTWMGLVLTQTADKPIDLLIFYSFGSDSLNRTERFRFGYAKTEPFAHPHYIIKSKIINIPIHLKITCFLILSNATEI